MPVTMSQNSEQEFLLARDVLEIGALISILKKDIPSFGRYLSQLKPYYLDYGSNMPVSPYKQQLLGLNLLCLLSQNKVAEFHTELERMSTHDILESVYIQHPRCIEQYLMEGNYNKLFLAQCNVPAKNYTFFMDILLDTIRDEIADCMEKSYHSIPIDEVKQMLYQEDPVKFELFFAKRGWQLGPDHSVLFTAAKQEEESAFFASNDLTKQMLGYARELEKIF